jgi:DNA-binding LytR/AlgR family response regulator
MIKCVIIDDEPLAIKLLKDYASQVPDLELVLATSDAFAALHAVREQDVDLVFLDIQMPELTGIQFMKILKGDCKVILTTAYEEYALQAFDYDVVDYLLKPFSPERFISAVNKARERIKAGKQSIANNDQATTTTAPDFILVKSEYKIIRIDLQQILFMESLRDYVAIHTATEGKILTLQSLKSFEDILPEKDFIRVHKSYIIAVKRINSIERKRIVINTTWIPIGDTYLDQFRERMSLK